MPGNNDENTTYFAYVGTQLNFLTNIIKKDQF